MKMRKERSPESERRRNVGLSTITTVFVSLVVAMGHPAFAQQPAIPPARPAAAPPAAQAAAVTAEPSSTTASYGDWVLRCQKMEAAKVCEVAQSLTLQGQATPIAQIAVGRPSPKEKYRLTVVLPNNISFPSTPRLGVGDKDPGVALGWRRCLPGGCFADAALEEDAIKRFRGAKENGRIAFSDGAGREIALPFSLNGFSLALDGLGKE